MKTISIKISGSGTPEQIASRLLDLHKDIINSIPNDLDGVIWEDDILITEIHEQ